MQSHQAEKSKKNDRIVITWELWKLTVSSSMLYCSPFDESGELEEEEIDDSYRTSNSTDKLCLGDVLGNAHP